MNVYVYCCNTEKLVWHNCMMAEDKELCKSWYLTGPSFIPLSALIAATVDELQAVY